MPAKPAVRIAGPSDASALSALLHTFNGEALAPEELARRMGQARGLEIALLGEVGGVLAGIMVLRTVLTLSSSEDWAEITELYVQPSFRRRGVGTALVEAAVEIARARGCSELHLLVDPQNTSALSFYEATGFSRDSWDMRRRL
jgi:ribosomal protein S18 acetylase RimI-like enzyme